MRRQTRFGAAVACEAGVSQIKIYIKFLSEISITWDEIVKKYPDKWVGLSQIDWENEANVRSAVVIGASDNSRDFLKRQFAGEDVFTRYTLPNNLY